jgi:hypothetical protein
MVPNTPVAVIDLRIPLAQPAERLVAARDNGTSIDALERIFLAARKARGDAFQRDLLAHVAQQQQHNLGQPEQKNDHDATINDIADSGQLAGEIQLADEIDVRNQDNRHDYPEYQHAQ